MEKLANIRGQILINFIDGDKDNFYNLLFHISGLNSLFISKRNYFYYSKDNMIKEIESNNFNYIFINLRDFIELFSGNTYEINEYLIFIENRCDQLYIYNLDDEKLNRYIIGENDLIVNFTKTELDFLENVTSITRTTKEQINLLFEKKIKNYKRVQKLNYIFTK